MYQINATNDLPGLKLTYVTPLRCPTQHKMSNLECWAPGEYVDTPILLGFLPKMTEGPSHTLGVFGVPSRLKMSNLCFDPEESIDIHVVRVYDKS